MNRRIGLFGGSFDPFHLGHFLIGRLAYESLRLHHIVYLPCAQSPLKKVQPLATASARIGWLRQGLSSESWARVSSWEIDRKGPLVLGRHRRMLEKKVSRSSAILDYGIGSVEGATPVERLSKARSLGALSCFPSTRNSQGNAWCFHEYIAVSS